MRGFEVFLIIGIGAVAACSSEMPTTKKSGSTKSEADASGNRDELASILSNPARLKAYVSSLASNPMALSELMARDKTEASELADLKDTNQRLCLRVQQLRNSCAASYRLMAQDVEQPMVCASGNSAQSVELAKWQVRLGTARKHRILADNNWESSEFGQGVTTISWQARSSGSTLSPKLIDLTQVQIVPVDGGAVSDLGDFSLLANGVAAFNASDVVRANESNGYYMVSMQSVLNLRASAACQLTQADWDAALNGGK